MIPTKDPAFLLDPLNVADGGRRLGAQQRRRELTSGAGSSSDDDSDGQSMVAEVSSTGSSPASDVKLLRYHCLDAPLQWSVFVRLRKSWGDLSLTEVQYSRVLEAIDKVKQGSMRIDATQPFVSAIVDRHCPELKPPTKSGPREGCTFLLLAVITGDTALLKTCLDLGANPNDVRFLTETNALQSYVRHGFTPFFMACICERIDCMAMLHDKGASVHVSDRWGRTPLHAAAALGNSEVMEWLLAHGAPRLVTDRDSFRPGEMCVGKVILPGPSEHVLLRPESKAFFNGAQVSASPDAPTCSCGSTRSQGSCGCFDDMHHRWFADRVSAQWIPFEFIDAISNAAATATDRLQQQQPNPESPTSEIKVGGDDATKNAGSDL
uniref:Ankyrin repeat protein n=1 Tax=Neobodo designis TaxID=312471 RepID=A0A7S1LPR9_NEODS|eukprot:CAMPEP_0174853334 /NCGR_PEP_ID=MMETSP1114-20130205/27982_1 /TAXON_ID=312471 /ORGANISM="Neobodo designis, Strain CCAP 1951/1" /LENGTH=378 /DNA_ID=CAMNT_0016087969 /DNA_START=29 /DNA_END=1165 /DNA_ORIENTATION=+